MRIYSRYDARSSQLRTPALCVRFWRFHLRIQSRRFSSTLPFVFLEGACIARSIDIIFWTPLSGIVSVWCWTLTMRNGPSVHDINVLNVGLSVLYTLLVFTVSGLSTNTNSFVLKINVSHTSLSIYRIHTCMALMRRGQKFVNVSITKSILAKRRLRNTREDTLSHRFSGIAHGKSNVLAVFWCLVVTTLNWDTV